MTADPDQQLQTNSYKIRLIEKITQLDDLELIRLIADQLSIDLDSTDVEGIKKTPGVVGGSARIREMRLPVWLLVSYHKLGKEDNWFLQNYPDLKQKDLKNAWEYYRLHQQEIEQEIIDNDEV
jgi:uncharacterized protein (DUF433 family)